MQNRRSAILVGLTIVLGAMVAGSPSAAPQSAPAPQGEVERLAALARLWTTVRYAHPYLAYKEIDWDAPLLAAIPKVRAATTTREYADAISGMLGALGDPATRVSDLITPPPEATRVVAEKDPQIERRDDVLILRMTNYQDLVEFPRVSAWGQAQLPAMRDATMIVVDLRVRTPGPAYALAGLFRSAAPALTSTRLDAPSVRTVFHSGYAPQTGSSSGGYYSALQLTIPDAIQPASKVAPKRVAFIANRASYIPDVALALQRSGAGLLIAEGPIDDRSAAPTLPVLMGEGITALVRTGEIINGERTGLHPDVEVAPAAAGKTDTAMDLALHYVKGVAPPTSDMAPPSPAEKPALPFSRPDKTYADTPYPSVEHRLLAVARMWGIVNYFFPYKHLMTRDWNGSLAEFIPKVIAAKDALEYGQAIAEMATWLEDSHVGVDSIALRQFYGTASAPLILRYIEGVPIVIGFADEAAGRSAGVEIGDVIQSVDGEDVAARRARLVPFLSVSNAWSLNVKLARALLSGGEGSEVRLALTGKGGRKKEATLKRHARYFTAPPVSRDPSFKTLDGNIGYVDLTRLEAREVDTAIDALMDTKAIVFDMRGYPRGVFPVLAPRLNRKDARYAATFLRPILLAGSADSRFTFQQPIMASTKPKYMGRTVMLIDERAISQSEHTGLFLEAASDVIFIGSPTSGANGDVTRMLLPGGLSVGFTGHDVRHADGRQLQKVGLEPHVDVLPTIEGIREGRDEVLERALRFLKEGS